MSGVTDPPARADATAPRTPRPRPLRLADGARLVAAWILSFVALLMTAWLLPGFTHTSWLPLLVAAAVTGLLGLVVRPVLVELAARVGWIAVALCTVFGQAVVMQLALGLVPGVSFASWWTAVAAAWIASAFGTVLVWLTSAGTDESFAASLMRIKPGHVTDPEVDGVLFVQLDGVSFPVMQWVLESGTMPTLRRWVDSGSHALHEWTVQLPCTTPASQQALLMGSAAGVPAFRWYDRELGRVLVANRPEDAAVIESRASTGQGLLVDDGVSVSNLFTGDAPKASMTMSRLEVTRGARRTRQVFARFLVRPDGLARSLSRAAAEVGRERFQMARQRRLLVHPRVHRSWTFAALRAFSNGLLRDLNTAIVSEEMMRGARSIYVDYVDYDEIAHHAGGTRIESLAALGGLDQVFAVLHKVAERAPRRYHVVVLSDHGQSQGEPFAARHGIELSALCRALTMSATSGVEGSIEGWGRVDSVLQDLTAAPSTGISGAASRRVRGRTQPDAASSDSELVVLGSGNLGLVYAPGPARLTLDDLDRQWPALVPGLVAHEGIGFVSAMSLAGPVAIGRSGRHYLDTGEVVGTDPLHGFGSHAAAMVRAATSMPEAPDLYVNSAVDPRTREIAAFEPLVGAHGGLGGWQDRAFVLAPADLLIPMEPIVGGDALHRHLVGVLEALHHRTSLPAGHQRSSS
ncbi:phage holin family protein [Nocardioides renjunii]|uniref:phage holin family protein n=1 Tax=Nocardioides renjunii TaxID=3095075 RepID=UPI002AFE6303|nr:phage holin family protein [Nocardioides sp. S-34]WQQ20353.1 phage holin family protein [Nocardioides sp. S-34]